MPRTPQTLMRVTMASGRVYHIQATVPAADAALFMGSLIISGDPQVWNVGTNPDATFRQPPGASNILIQIRPYFIESIDYQPLSDD